MLKHVLMASVLVSPLLFTGCGSDDDDDNGNSTTVSAVVAESPILAQLRDREDEFSTLLVALEATELDITLNDLTQQFTLFAPTNEAFAALGESTITNLLGDTDTLSNILQYHVISGSEVLAEQAIELAGMTVEMTNGQSVGISQFIGGTEADNRLLINTSTVTESNVSVQDDNGVIHVLDRVLTPPALESARLEDNIVEVATSNSSFSTLVAALQAANLVDALSGDGPFTVFAPTDSAFDALPEGTLDALLADTDALTQVLQRHVVSGEVNSIAAYAANGTDIPVLSSTDDQPVTIPVAIVDGALQVGGATVTAADLYVSNGVIHVIDQVITEDSTTN